MKEKQTIRGQQIERIGFCSDCQPNADHASNWEMVSFWEKDKNGVPGRVCEWCQKRKFEFAVKIASS